MFYMHMEVLDNLLRMLHVMRTIAALTSIATQCTCECTKQRRERTERVHLGLIAAGARGCRGLRADDGWRVLRPLRLRHRAAQGESLDQRHLARSAQVPRKCVPRHAIKCTCTLLGLRVLYCANCSLCSCVLPNLPSTNSTCFESKQTSSIREK